MTRPNHRSVAALPAVAGAAAAALLVAGCSSSSTAPSTQSPNRRSTSVRLYDHRPAMSLRAIGATPEVDLHHDNVGKIRAGATAVFGTAPGGEHR